MFTPHPIIAAATKTSTTTATPKRTFARAFTRGQSLNHRLTMALWASLAGVALGCSPPPPKSAPSTTEPTSSEASSTSTQPAQGEDSAVQSASVFVVHQVPDFEAYRKQFDDNAKTREQAGVTRVVMTRLVNQPDRVGLHFTAGSLDSINAFIAGSDYERVIEADQATESTLLWIATDELDELPSTVSPGSVSLFKKFPVNDAKCVVTQLIAHQSELGKEGLLGFSLHATESDAHVVILHLLATDQARLEKLYNGAPLLPLLQSCGASKLEHPLFGINQ